MRKNIILKNKRNNLDEVCQICLLDREEIDLMISLQNEVYNTLQSKSLLMIDTKEDIEFFLTQGGVILGVFNADDELIAYRNTSIPGPSFLNLGRDIGLIDDALLNVIHLESTIVHPDYRGNHLQIELFNIFSSLSNLEDKHLLCTIAPENIISLHNILSLGFTIQNIKIKQTSDNKKYLRFILYKGPNHTSIDLEDQKEILSKVFDQGPQCYGYLCEITEADERTSFYNEYLLVITEDISGHFDALYDGFEGIAYVKERNCILYVKNQMIDFEKAVQNV